MHSTFGYLSLIEFLRNELKKLPRLYPHSSYISEGDKNILERFIKKIRTKNDDFKRNVVETFVNKVIIYKDRIEIRLQFINFWFGILLVEVGINAFYHCPNL